MHTLHTPPTFHYNHTPVHGTHACMHACMHAHMHSCVKMISYQIQISSKFFENFNEFIIKN